MPRPLPLALLACSLIAACPGPDDPPPNWGADESGVWLEEESVRVPGIVVLAMVDGMAVGLDQPTLASEVPIVDVLGQGQGVTLSSTTTGLELTLSARPHGRAGLLLSARATSRAEEPITLEGFLFSASPLKTRRAVLGAVVDGYQSWSSSLFAALDHASSDLAWRTSGNNTELVMVDPQVSWWVSALALDGATVVAGAVTADRWKTRVLPHDDGGARLLVACGLNGDTVTLAPGESVESELLLLSIDRTPQTGLESWADAVASAMPAPSPPFGPVGWNSWNTLFEEVTEADVMDHARFLHERLPSLGVNNIQVDDGWQVAWGDWRTNDKFPSGLVGLASQLHELGFAAGIWMAPFLVEVDLELDREHPDWLLRKPDGSLVVYVGGGRSNHVLDVTHPDARDSILAAVQTVLDAGFRYLKLDFLFVAAMEGVRHDTGATSMAAYRGIMAAVMERAEAAGAYVLACGAPTLPTAGVAHGLRTTTDIASGFGYGYPFIKNVLRTLSLRYAYNRFIAADPDTPLLRGLTAEEARLVFSAALIGGRVFALGDDLRTMDEEQLALLERIAAMPLPAAIASGEARGAVPLDLLGEPIEGSVTIIDLVAFPTYHVPSLWEAPLAGGDRVVAALNWSEEEQTLTLPTAGATSITELWLDEAVETGAEDSRVRLPPRAGRLYWVK